MTGRTLKILGLVAAVFLLVGAGVAVGGGAVYAMRQSDEGATIHLEPGIESEPGIVVAAVVPEGPAEEAGVVRGDILLVIDEEPLEDAYGLVQYLTTREPGETVVLSLLHGDEERTLEITLGEKNGHAYLGVVPCLPFLSRADLGAPHLHYNEQGRLPWFTFMLPYALPHTDFEHGVIVGQVVEDSPAAAAGLEAGDIITAVDEGPIDGPQVLVDAIADHQPGDTVLLTVCRADSEETIEVALGEHPEEEKAYLGVSVSGFLWMHHLEGDELPEMVWSDGEHHQFDMQFGCHHGELHFIAPHFELHEGVIPEGWPSSGGDGL